jgi:hypothetical protein
VSYIGPYVEHLFPELPNIYLSRDIKSVSELYGQNVYIFAESGFLSRYIYGWTVGVRFLRLLTGSDANLLSYPISTDASPICKAARA